MARRIADLVIKIGADSYEFTQNVNKLNGSLGKFSNDLGKIGKDLSLKLTAPLAAFATLSVKAFADSEKAVAKVGQAVKQTGNSAGFSLKQLQEEAAKLQGTTIFEDDEILDNVTAQLLMFPTIVGDNFLAAQKSALDLSTILKTDLQSATLMLGKALQDPISGLTALGKRGIRFNDTQKDAIKHLMQQNDLYGAQKVILDKLNSSYAGQAEAQAKVGIGPMLQLKNQWNDFMEQVGKAIMPTLHSLTDLLKDVTMHLKAIPEPIMNIAVKFAGLVAAIGPVLIVISQLRKMLPLLSLDIISSLSKLGPYIAILTAIGALFAKYKVDSAIADMPDYEGAQTQIEGNYGDEKDVSKLQKALDEANANYQKKLKANSSTEKELKTMEYEVKLLQGLVTSREQQIEIEKALGEAREKEQAEQMASLGIINQIEKKIDEIEKKKKAARSVKEIAKLNVQLDALNDKLKAVKESGKGVDYSTTMKAIPSIQTYVMNQEQFDHKMEGTALPNPEKDPIVQYINGIADKSREAYEKLQETIDQMQESLKNAFGTAINSLASSIGQFAAGDFGIEGLLAGILNIMGNFLTTLGSQLIEMSIIMVSFRKAMAWLIANPMLSLAIGIGMVATGAFMQSMAAKVSAPKLANGGIAYGPTYAMVGDNINAGVDPEVIAPLSKLKNMLGGNSQSVNLSGEFIVRGSDLVYVLDRTNQSFNRRR